MYFKISKFTCIEVQNIPGSSFQVIMKHCNGSMEMHEQYLRDEKP